MSLTWRLIPWYFLLILLLASQNWAAFRIILLQSGRYRGSLPRSLQFHHLQYFGPALALFVYYLLISSLATNILQIWQRTALDEMKAILEVAHYLFAFILWIKCPMFNHIPIQLDINLVRIVLISQFLLHVLELWLDGYLPRWACFRAFFFRLTEAILVLLLLLLWIWSQIEAWFYVLRFSDGDIFLLYFLFWELTCWAHWLWLFWHFALFLV